MPDYREMTVRIPKPDDDGGCDSDCPVCYDGGTCNLNLHSKEGFIEWDTHPRPGPGCVWFDSPSPIPASSIPKCGPSAS